MSIKLKQSEVEQKFSFKKINLVIRNIVQKKLFRVLVVVVVLITTVFFLWHNFLNKKIQQVVDKNIEITDDGAWCWFQSPSAVQFKDKTYVGWVKKNGDIMIGVYDNITKNISSTVLHPGLQIDDHAAPSILIREDGKIMVFYSAHVGDNMFYRVSVNSEDISSWDKEKTVNTNMEGIWKYTYSNPVQLSKESGKIYLFWRGGNGEPTFSASTDGGNSWSEARNLFFVSGERPYMKVSSNGTDKIYFTFTDGHPNEVDNNSIYFAYYQKGSFYKADGTLIKSINDLPLTPTDVDMVYDSTKSGIKAWNWDIAFDKKGFPIIVYAIFPTINDHRYRYAHWNGKSWDDNEITPAGGSIDKINEPYYSGGATLNHENPSVVFLSKNNNRINEIEKWSTQNSGFNWNSENITSKSVKQNVRPIVPRNHNSDSLNVIWMNGEYTSYTKYDTVLKAKFQ